MMPTRKKLTNGELVDVVLAARDRIAQSWSHGALARNQHGASTSPTNRNAEAWCMVGALRVEAPLGWRNLGIRDVVQVAFDEAGILKWEPNSPCQKIESFNDSRGQEKAVGAFDELARWLKDTGWEPPVDEFMPMNDGWGSNGAS